MATRISVVPGGQEGIEKLVHHLHRCFTDKTILAKLDLLGEGSISLRSFFCTLLPFICETEIEVCLRWCRTYRAQDVVKSFLEAGDVSVLDVHDVRAIFQVMDTDSDGVIFRIW